LRRDAPARSSATPGLELDPEPATIPGPEPATIPEHRRAIQVPGAAIAMLWLTRESIGAIALLVAAIAAIPVAYAAHVDTVNPVHVIVVSVVVVALSVRRVWWTSRAWFDVIRRRWRPFDCVALDRDGSVVELRDRDGTAMHFATSGTVRRRASLSTLMYAHVWFAGDPNRGGVIVPAGGGPAIYLRRREPVISAAPGRARRFAYRSPTEDTQSLPAQLIRPRPRQRIADVLPSSEDKDG
jgi:hypothetical protein